MSLSENPLRMEIRENEHLIEHLSEQAHLKNEEQT